MHGLLTETGQSIDGIWTVYWRKLYVLLTETGRSIVKYGLLRETGWSIDGNWMVYLKKLDGLLMEWVQSTYGNIFLGAWKCDFFRVPKPTFSGTTSFLQLIFCILEARKCDFCRVVKHRVQDYEASCEQPATAEKAFECDSKFEFEQRKALSSVTKKFALEQHKALSNVNRHSTRKVGMRCRVCCSSFIDFMCI